jgi:putative spermidine/putrescine transport system permease protein
MKVFSYRVPWTGLALLTVMGLALLGPILTVVIWAFAEKWRYPNLLPAVWGLKFWFLVLGRETVVHAILTSLSLATIATTLAAAVCWPAAYAFARLSFPGRQALLFSFMAANAVPKFALFVGIATVFLRLDLIGTFWGVVFVQMLSGVLFMIWIPTAAFRGIPPMLEEAAFDLGASRLRVFWEITIPQAFPALAASYLLAFVAILFEVDSALLIGAPKITTMPLLLLQLSTQVNVQEAAVMCVLIWVPCFIILVLSRRFMSANGIAQGFGA